MDLFMKIIVASTLGIMVFFLFKNYSETKDARPKGTASDWKSFVVVVVFVGLFLMLMISSVSGVNRSKNVQSETDSANVLKVPNSEQKVQEESKKEADIPELDSVVRF